MEHYNELTDAQKKKIKSNNTVFIVLGLIIPVLLPLLIIPIGLLFPGIFIGIPDSSTRLFAIIFVVVLFIYIISVFFLKDKKVHKILQGFEL